MTTKYSASLHSQPTLGTMGEYNWYNRSWSSYWFCRELAILDMRDNLRIGRIPSVLRLKGENMRSRTDEEQKGMAKFANIMFPEHFTFVDDRSIYIESKQIDSVSYGYPMIEVMSVAFFFIKYLTIQMKDRVDVDRLCRTFIKRKHQCFHGNPDQQLGTAFYTWAYIHYKDELVRHSRLLSTSNGPGTAMRQLANEDEQRLGGQSEASKLYSALLDEWTTEYKPDIAKMLNYHCTRYARQYYMPVLLQDIYKRVFDGDGYFDNLEYGEDEW